MTHRQASLTADIGPGTIHAFQTCAHTLLTKASCPDFVLTRVDLILEELLMNIHLHGYGDAPGQARLTCALDEDCTCTLRIEDWAPPFNLLDAPIPDASSPLHERLPGGQGIPVVKRFASAIEYRYEDGRNIVTVTVSSDASR